MQMAQDYKDYWQFGGTSEYGDELWWSKDDSQSENHMPIALNRGAGSLCISSLKTFRWSVKNQAWEEM